MYYVLFSSLQTLDIDKMPIMQIAELFFNKVNIQIRWFSTILWKIKHFFHKTHYCKNIYSARNSIYELYFCKNKDTIHTRIFFIYNLKQLHLYIQFLNVYVLLKYTNLSTFIVQRTKFAYQAGRGLTREKSGVKISWHSPFTGYTNIEKYAWFQSINYKTYWWRLF